MRLVLYSQFKDRGIRYSREQIRRKEKGGTFPLHIDLGVQRIGWLELEIDAWLKKRIAERDARAANKAAPEPAPEIAAAE